jgi:membrane associated rhomboid family serine protease
MIPLYDDNPTHRFPILTIALIVANVFVFFGWQTRVGLEESVMLAGFVPAELGSATVPGAKHILTSMFMHGGFMHLLGNMWFLWIFGDNVENECGPVRFLVFYLLCGIAATLSYALFNPNSIVPLVGASGAISGVLGAYLVRHPNAAIRTLIPLGIFTRIVDLPAWFFLFIWIGMQVLSQASLDGRHGGGGVAYLAHIGGFAAGVGFIFVFGGKARPNERRRVR